MSDGAVAELLRSEHPLVVIEAAAGCGKTYQGASLARDIANTLGGGRLLILTHTHAACGVFAEHTKGASARVEIRTIDALIAQITIAYHKALNLPANPSAWAWEENGKGFQIMAAKAAAFLKFQPMVAKMLAHRFPMIICDEHQDSTNDQHAVVMAIHRGGAMLRIFTDPLQRLYGEKTDKAAKADHDRWNELKKAAVCEKLEHPHRWESGSPELGMWVLSARRCLQNGEPIDLTSTLPASLRVLIGNNVAQNHTGYQLTKDHRLPIDNLVNSADQLMILGSQNALVRALRAFWNRSIPLWEGHTREALAMLVTTLSRNPDNAEALAKGLVDFLGSVATGFTSSTHGKRLLKEILEGCKHRATKKPANIQAIARQIIEDQSHVGVSGAISLVGDLVRRKEAGFDKIKIDHWVEFRDAIQLGQYPSPDEGFAEIARKRSYSRPSPPARFLSSIHKAKGLECDHALLMACDSTNFSQTTYSRCKLYVALSRAKKSLTLVVPTTNPSPLVKLT